MPNAPPHRQHGIPHANAPYGGYQPFPPHHQQAAPTLAYGFFNNPHAPPFNAPPVHAGTDPLPSSRPQPRSQRTLSSMDVRPDSYRFKFMRSGLADLETCKEIFEGWSKELERSKSQKRSDLEQQVVSHVDSLRDDTNKALESSRDLVRSYGTFARLMDSKFRSLAQRGGYVFPDPDITRKFEEISGHSSELMKHASQMQEKLIDLVTMLDNAKQDSKKALWKRIWSWLIQTFKILAKVLDFGSSLAGYIPNVGSAVSSIMQTGSTVCASAAKICQEMNDGADESVTFDKILILLRQQVPESAKKAEAALRDFNEVQLKAVVQIGKEVEAGQRLGWMEAHEAKQAADEWSDAIDELLKLQTNVQVRRNSA